MRKIACAGARAAIDGGARPPFVGRTTADKRRVEDGRGSSRHVIAEIGAGPKVIEWSTCERHGAALNQEVSHHLGAADADGVGSRGIRAGREDGVLLGPRPRSDRATGAAAPIGRGRVPGAGGRGASPRRRAVEIPVAAPVGIRGDGAPSINVAPGRVQVLVTIVVTGP